MMNEKFDYINDREDNNDELTEFVTVMPSWILKVGMAFIMLLFCSLGIGGHLIKIPQTVGSAITLHIVDSLQENIVLPKI